MGKHDNALQLSINKNVKIGLVISLFSVLIFSLTIQGANAGTNTKFSLTIGTEGGYGLTVDSVMLSNPNPAPGESLTATVKWRASACPSCIVKANAFGDWNKLEIARFYDGSNTGGTNTFTFIAPGSEGNYNLRLIWAYDIGEFSNYDSTNLPSPSQASSWQNSAAGILDLPFSVASTKGTSKNQLIAEYHFEGDAADSSGNGNNGATYGAVFASGIKGNALSFDGLDDYFSAQMTNSFNLVKTQGTILAWINFKDELLAGGTSCPYGSRALMLWRFGTNNIKSQASIDCTGSIISDWRSGLQVGSGTGQSLKSGQWYQIALVYDSNTVNLYINGQKVKSSSLTGDLGDADDKFWIGRNGNAAQPMYFHGLIDEVKIYNYALSANEIQTNYNSLTPAITITTITSPTGPQRPGLIAPLNGAVLNNTPTFQWSSVPEAVRYQWDLSERSDFASIAATWQTTQISILPAQAGTLIPGKTYYWRVAAFNSQNTKGDYSQSWSFTYSKIVPQELTVRISPLSKFTFKRDEQIYLNAEVTGGRSPYQVIAVSDRDGTLASGSTTSNNFDYGSKDRLSTGAHNITFKFTDADRKIATDSITIKIEERAEPPEDGQNPPDAGIKPPEEVPKQPPITKRHKLSGLEFEGPYAVRLNEGVFYVYFGHAGDIKGPRAFALVVKTPFTKITDIAENDIIRDSRAERAIRMVIFHEKAPLIKHLLSESDPQVDRVASLTQGVVGALIASAFGLIDGTTYAAQFWLGKEDVPFEIITKYGITALSLTSESAAIDSSISFDGSIVTIKDTEIWEDAVGDWSKETLSNTIGTIVDSRAVFKKAGDDVIFGRLDPAETADEIGSYPQNIGIATLSVIYGTVLKSFGLDNSYLDVIDPGEMDWENLKKLKEFSKNSIRDVGFSAFRNTVDKFSGGFDTFVMMTRLSAASLTGRDNLNNKYSSNRIDIIDELRENNIANAESFYGYYLSLMHDFYEKNYLKEGDISYFKDTSHAAIYELRSTNIISTFYYEAGKEFSKDFYITFDPKKSYEFTIPESPIIAQNRRIQTVILRYYMPKNLKQNKEESFFAVVYNPFYVNGIPFQSGTSPKSKLGVSIRNNQGQVFDHISLDEATDVEIPTGQESTIKARILTSAAEGSYDIAAAVWDADWSAQFSSTNWERSKINIQKSTFIDKAYQAIRNLIEKVVGVAPS